MEYISAKKWPFLITIAVCWTSSWAVLRRAQIHSFIFNFIFPWYFTTCVCEVLRARARVCLLMATRSQAHRRKATLSDFYCRYVQECIHAHVHIQTHRWDIWRVFYSIWKHQTLLLLLPKYCIKLRLGNTNTRLDDMEKIGTHITCKCCFLLI